MDMLLDSVLNPISQIMVVFAPDNLKAMVSALMLDVADPPSNSHSA